jgi:hypothetical protein
MPQPWDVDWSSQVNNGASPAGGNPLSGIFGGGSTGPSDPNYPSAGPPPGVNAAEYKKKLAENAANEAQNLRTSAEGVSQFISHLYDYQDLIHKAPEGSVGPTMGGEWYRGWIGSPASIVGSKFGWDAPGNAAKYSELINSKAADMTAALFKARYGGAIGEPGQRGNRAEFDQIRNSIGTAQSFNKDTAWQAAVNHAKEVSDKLNYAYDKGQVNAQQFLQNLGPEKVQFGIKYGAIDPQRFLSPTSPEAAQRLPAGTIFKTTDGRIMTR